MKPPHEPPDLLHHLADDAASLPGLAAAEARRARSLRIRHRRSAALAITVLITAASAWHLIPSSPHAARVPTPPSPQPAPPLVIARTPQQAASDPLPLPDGLSPEQEKVVTAARGLPIVLIRHTSGKVARIHVIAQ